MRPALLVAVIFAAACDTGRDAPGAQGPITAFDDNGASVTLAQPPRRVIALVPAATDIIHALGRADVLIARAEEDSMSFLKSLPSVGRVLDPSIERIIAMQPDLVIVWADATVVLQHLAKANIPTYAVRFDRVDDGATNTQRIGKMLGEDGRAHELTARIARELAMMQRAYQDAPRPSVLYLLDTEPLWTAGPETFVDDVIHIAGGRNTFLDLRTQWAQVSLESVVRRQPDIIVFAGAGRPHLALEMLRRAPGWRDLRAVQNRRVYFMDPDRVNRPGPSIVETSRLLARMLHPDRVK